MNPSDSKQADQVATLAADLRELRRAAGSPSYTDLARKTGVPRSTLHDGLTGRRLPSLETTLAVATICGGDPVTWKRRWVAARTSVDEPPLDNTVPRRRRLALVIAAVVVLLAAGVTTAAFVRASAACSPVREYRVDTPGAVLSATGATIGATVAGDTVDVATLTHDRYPHRYLATVRRTGVHGYVDEAKLTFVAETCR